MNTQKLYGILLTGVFLLTACSTTSKDSSTIKTPTINNTIEVETKIEIEDNQALLHKEFGEVFFTIPNKKEFQLKNDISIPTGTIVRTTNGTAIIAFLDNSVMTIDENTEIEINYTKTDISISQNIGKTWHRVTSLVSSENSYEVTTPTALATVRGTIFGVEINEAGKTNILVKESIVDISQYTEKNKPPIFIAKIEEGKGFFEEENEEFFKEVREQNITKKPVIKELTKVDFQDSWIIKNEKLDLNWKLLKEEKSYPIKIIEDLTVSKEQGIEIDKPELNIKIDNNLIKDLETTVNDNLIYKEYKPELSYQLDQLIKNDISYKEYSQIFEQQSELNIQLINDFINENYKEYQTGTITELNIKEIDDFIKKLNEVTEINKINEVNKDTEINNINEVLDILDEQYMLEESQIHEASDILLKQALDTVILNQAEPNIETIIK